MHRPRALARRPLAGSGVWEGGPLVPSLSQTPTVVHKDTPSAGGLVGVSLEVDGAWLSGPSDAVPWSRVSRMGLRPVPYKEGTPKEEVGLQ